MMAKHVPDYLERAVAESGTIHDELLLSLVEATEAQTQAIERSVVALERIAEKMQLVGGGVMASLQERIEAAFDRAIDSRMVMLDQRRRMAEIEAETKMRHADEWAAAKNNDVRAVLLAGWLADHPYYQHHKPEYEQARDDYRVALLDIERLKLLVALAGKEA